MFFDIYTINIGVSIRVRGLHLVPMACFYGKKQNLTYEAMNPYEKPLETTSHTAASQPANSIG
jgi:hypothetical protein